MTDLLEKPTTPANEKHSPRPATRRAVALRDWHRVAADAFAGRGHGTGAGIQLHHRWTPGVARTARCSSMIPAYWTGISQPAKSIIRAPSAT